MTMKTEVVAFTNGETTFIKETRDLIDSNWFMINAYKTVRGYSYEQVLEWAIKTKAVAVHGGQNLILTMKSYEDYTMSDY